MTQLEKVARAICEADPTAPDPDAPIYIRMRAAKAWEARLPLAQAAVLAVLESIREPDPALAAELRLRMVQMPLGNGQTFETPGLGESGETAWRRGVDHLIARAKEQA